jgi:flagellin-like hook-associated protein FlgL
MAMYTARNLNNTYDRLSDSVQRLSSGLRINSAADDAAGLAIRELMRADIATMQQGIRNAADAISMIQTADGALSVIDEKLVRMKELAEQAATGTYTTLQREIINSEYQAMAAEIDRIAAATNFNGVKLLDGSITNQHGGQGLKIHFGVGNNPAEDYYFVNIGDVRATSQTGLRVGGDAKNDIWGQGAAGAAGTAGPGCCTAGFDSLDGNAGFISGQTFAYGYNWDWLENDDPDLLTGKYLAGRYTVGSSESLQDLIYKINQGSQSRVGIKLDASAMAEAVKNGGTAAVCVGDEAYIFGSAALAGGTTLEGPFEGVIYKYLSEGNYLGEGFLANVLNGSRAYGFGLTAAQKEALEKAGVNLDPLELRSAEVKASGSSLKSSAEAKTLLLKNLNRAWAALGLSSFSGLATVAGMASGFVLSSAAVLQSALANVNVSDSTLSAVVLNDKSLRIHTGVYADQNGNWTDDRRVASALNLSEVVFTIINRDSPLTEFRIDGFSSRTYAAMNGQTLYLGKVSDLTQAGITLFQSAAFTKTISARGATLQEASAALLERVEDAFLWEYRSAENLLTLRVSAGGDAGVGKSAAQISASALAQGTFFNPAGALDVNQTLNISADVWVDAYGNFTSSKEAAQVLGLTRLVYTFQTDAAGDFTSVALNGTKYPSTGTTDPLLSVLPATGSTLTSLMAMVDQSIRHQISSRQGVTTTGEGRLSFQEIDVTKLWPPTAAETDAQKGAAIPVPPGPNLEAEVEIAGKKSPLTATFGTALSALNRSSTTLGDILDAARTALTEVLASHQNTAAASGMTGQGRLVTTPSGAPSGPSSFGLVDSPTLDVSFYSGELEKSLAKGSYGASGYFFNSATGYGLSSAQLALINLAGLDVSKLLLNRALVSASAMSTVSSASARALLLTKLNELWSALTLLEYSALVISAGVATGYGAVSSAAVISAAPAGSMVYSAALGGTILKEQKSVTVKTGVYADSRGNWTDDSALAADLGLTEITYTLSNNDLTWYTTSATYVSPAYRASGEMLADLSTMSELIAASNGFTAALNTFLACSVHAFGSGETYLAASGNLLISARAIWEAKYRDKFSSLIFYRGDDGTGIDAPAFALISQSAQGVVDVPGTAGKIISGSTLKVHTGVYADASGNWTADLRAASAFTNLKELVYEVKNSGGEYLLTGPGTTAKVILPITGIGSLDVPVLKLIRNHIAALQLTHPLSGSLRFETQSGPTAPTGAELTALKSPQLEHTVNTADPPGRVGFLDVKINIAGVSYAVFDNWSPPSLSVDTVMEDVAKELTLEIEMSLRYLKNEALPTYSGQGRIHKTAPDPPEGPENAENIPDLTEKDVYHEKSDQKAVSKKGILDETKWAHLVASAGTAYFDQSGYSNFGARALASAINHNKDSKFWAMVQSFDSNGEKADMVYVFTKDGGDFDGILACDVADGDEFSRNALAAISFENTETGKHNQSGTNLSLGGRKWGTVKPIQSKKSLGNEVWNLTLNGLDVGRERDLWIAAVSGGQNEIKTPGLADGIINGLDRYSFVELQNADDGPWRGAEVRTQSAAQEALDALTDALARKDKVRADLGAYQNRLENTITNLEIQVEALQQSESRISDVDMATEMTEFVRNQVLSQAAVSMLSQANSLPQLALSLLSG